MAFSFFKKKDTSASDNANKKSNSKYRDLTIKEVRKETADAISIIFDAPTDTISYTAGQFLTLIQDINGESVRRAYSLCTAPNVDANPAVTVKRVQGGLMSNYLNDHAKAGDVMKIMEPMGNFTTVADPKRKRHLIMFGGGSGITPLMGITKAILHGEDESIVSLIYCNRDIDSIIFKKEFDDMETRFEGRLQVIHVLDNAPLNWQGPSGLLNHDMLVKILERIPSWGADKTQYLMCGPEGMMKNVEVMLDEMKVPKENIYKESFVQGTIDKAEKNVESGATATYEVTVIYDGEEHKFDVPPNKTILETALSLDIDLPFSCQSGLCTACRGKCLSGEVALDEDEGLSEAERNEGYVLTCVGHPKTPGVVIEIG
jgi:ring-1,2-phenylacetyl-CoA epoxidase subunit PaaE